MTFYEKLNKAAWKHVDITHDDLIQIIINFYNILKDIEYDFDEDPDLWGCVWNILGFEESPSFEQIPLNINQIPYSELREITKSLEEYFNDQGDLFGTEGQMHPFGDVRN